MWAPKEQGLYVSYWFLYLLSIKQSLYLIENLMNESSRQTKQRATVNVVASCDKVRMKDLERTLGITSSCPLALQMRLGPRQLKGPAHTLDPIIVNGGRSHHSWPWHMLVTKRKAGNNGSSVVPKVPSNVSHQSLWPKLSPVATPSGWAGGSHLPRGLPGSGQQASTRVSNTPIQSVGHFQPLSPKMCWVTKRSIYSYLVVMSK